MLFRRIKSRAADEQPLRCSFCNKEQTEVGKLIAGPAVFICDECVRVCSDILADDARFPARVGPAQAEPPVPASAPVEPTTRVIRCTLCGLHLPWEEGLPIPARGVLCPGCTAAIEATLAQKRETLE
jgi:hypothetical protein